MQRDGTCAAGPPRSRGRRDACLDLWWVVLLLAASIPVRVQSQPASPTEYEVKAAFLYNFGRFVSWPHEAFEDSSAALVIGLLGQDPFGATIDAMVGDKKLQGRPVRIRRFESYPGPASCHILFTTWSDPEPLRRLFAALGESPVLTVGESAEFAALGGIVRFFLEENKVRFEVNSAAAERAALTISSKMLRLAHKVGKEPER